MKLILNIMNPKNLVTTTNIIITLVVSYAIASGITTAIAPKNLFKPTINIKGSENNYNIAKLKPLYLFGAPQKNIPTPTPTEPIIAPPLSLILIGVIKASSINKSVAVIQTSSQPKIYIAGDDIDDHTKLLQILGNQIIVSYYNNEYTVKIKKTSSGLLSNNKNTEQTINKKVVKPKVSNNISRAKIQIPASFDDKLSYIRKQIKTEPLSLINTIKGAPLFRRGKMFGVKVFPGDDKELFKALSLQPKDIITKINGIPLNDFKQLTELMNLASAATVFDVELERDGVLQGITITLPQ